MKHFFVFLFFMLAVTLNVESKGVKKKGNSTLRVLEAYSQRILPGIPGAQPKTDFHFIVIWEGKKYPETVFWRGENGWLTCNLYKAHWMGNRTINVPRDYRFDPVTNDAIHKGDTLELRPVTGGKFPVPPEIPKDAKNTLFYKSGGSGWMLSPVKNITRKPDIPLP